MKIKFPAIIIDSREQSPWLFSSISPMPTIITKGLKTGDYSLSGFDNSGIIVERKSLSDLYGSCGKGRDRLEAEFKRMSKFEYAAIIIERSLGKIVKNPPECSRMLPKAVFHTLISWSIKYNVHVWTAEDRIMAEKICHSLFEKFWKYQMEKI